MLDFNVNLLAVGLIFISRVILGALWYGPLFHNLRMKQFGIDPKNKEAVKPYSGSPFAYAMTMIFSLLFSFTFELIINNLKINISEFSILGAYLLGFILIFGLVIPATTKACFWDRSPKIITMIGNAYEIACMLFAIYFAYSF